MHEAGLAARIAAEVRGRDAIDGAVVRVSVRGGHHEPAPVEHALRLHLLAALPGLDAGRLQVVFEPSTRVCSCCSSTFLAPAGNANCPTCGGPALPDFAAESVAVEVIIPKAHALARTVAPVGRARI